MEGTQPFRRKYAPGAFLRGCGGFSHVRSASLRGDDWKRGVDTRKIPGTVLFSKAPEAQPAKLQWTGICVPETPGLCCHESQTTESIIPDASAVPFLGLHCSAKISGPNGSSPIEIRTLPYRHSVFSFHQLVETDQNQSVVGDKHELPLV